MDLKYVLELVQILGTPTVAVVLLGFILMEFVRRFNVSRAEQQVATSEGGLYQHLSEQVATLTERLDTMHAQYNKMFQENVELHARIQRLESCEVMVEKLQAKLNEKDQIIMERDTQLNVLFNDLRLRDHKIVELQERLHILELRLAKDESHWKKGQDDLK